MNGRGAVLLHAPVRHWECPNCPVTEEFRGQSNRFHRCHGEGVFAGLYAPLVLSGSRANVTAVEREDYVGDDVVRLHQGRPVMSVVTEHADGRRDCLVFAPAGRLAGASA